MITAHSGADGTKENSLEFVAYAMQTGADALEVDVRMGENGILILSHDKTDEDAVRLADVFRMMGKYPGDADQLRSERVWAGSGGSSAGPDIRAEDRADPLFRKCPSGSGDRILYLERCGSVLEHRGISSGYL